MTAGAAGTSATDAAAQPMPHADAKRIARAYLPRSSLGNRWNYYYSKAKLASDPLYPGVLAALRGSDAALLDVGCGIGLLAHALRHDGQRMPYHGTDIDQRKIGNAMRAADAAGLADVAFGMADLTAGLPAYAGSVAILDVLQYLSHSAQDRLLAAAIGCLVPGARLVIRAAVDNGQVGTRTTRLTDQLTHLIGWMQTVPRDYPREDDLRATFESAGLHARFTPLSGNALFHHWLIVAEQK